MNGVPVAGFAIASGLLAAAAMRRGERDRLAARAGWVSGGGSARPTSRVRRRIGRAALRCLAVAVGLGVGGIVAGVPGAVAGVVAAVAVPVARRRRGEAKRAELVEAQIADAVSGIAAGLRAGLSLTQAIGFAADEGEAPLGPSLHELVDRTSLGVPFAQSLERWTESLPGPEVRLVAGVLGLHHRTGGDAPAVLDQVARTLRERRAATREVRSLTAQARLSGAILGFLPIGFFLFLSATSRGDIAAAYHSPSGATAIAVGLAMQAAAFVWIRRLLRVEA